VPRTRAWADTTFHGGAIVAGTPLTVDLLSEAPTSDTLTVVRLVGDFSVFYTVTFTVTDSLSVVDVGIGVTSQEGFAIKGTSMPNPGVTPAQYPPRGWIYAATKPVSHVLEGTTGLHVVTADFKFDIRAMRKIDKGILFLTVANTNITVGGGMNIVGRVRALCLT